MFITLNTKFEECEEGRMVESFYPRGSDPNGEKREEGSVAGNEKQNGGRGEELDVGGGTSGGGGGGRGRHRSEKAWLSLSEC